MYDLHRLRLLRELKYRGTLAEVARALGYSPSSVSQQLSILAREAGTPLLEAAGRGVALTPAAEVLVEHTERILAEMESARAQVAASRGTVSGSVRLAAFQTAAHTFVPGAVAALHAAHPGVRVRVSHIGAEAALPALIAGDFDLVLWERYPGRPLHTTTGAEDEVLGEDPLHLAVPSAWVRETGDPSPSALTGHPWVMEHPGSDPREWAVAECRRAGLEPEVAFESADVLLHARLVSDGYAAAFLPRLGLPVSPSFRVGAPVAARTVLMSRRSGRSSDPAVRALASALRETSAPLLQ
ncbi:MULTISPECIES: LysR family transcriptional regulator [Brevibacterium]|uniref:LysR family transcriptional regulator n=1 Tax=Brevibacterium salitolerans TaxID=1403566 RepID=A0ABN2WLR1_9MICO|nr:LysR substrate-binding domain-containing protein [Brevibacterium sp.]